jgi:hypothetical protein
MAGASESLRGDRNPFDSLASRCNLGTEGHKVGICAIHENPRRCPSGKITQHSIDILRLTETVQLVNLQVRQNDPVRCDRVSNHPRVGLINLYHGDIGRQASAKSGGAHHC